MSAEIELTNNHKQAFQQGVTMNIKKSMMRGLALYGASSMMMSSGSATRETAQTLIDLANDVR